MSLIDEIRQAQVAAGEGVVLRSLERQGLLSPEAAALLPEPTITQLTDEICAWANATFPKRTPQSAFLKFFSEIGELVDDPHGPGEYADVAVMLFDLARMHNIDLAKAIRDKMVVNRGRVWEATATGVFKHVDTRDDGQVLSKPRPPAPTPGECNREFSNGTVCTRPAGSFCAGCV